MSNLHPVIAAALAPWTPPKKRRSLAGDFESTVSGIPCRIEVTEYTCVQGSYDYNADSDWDYQGYEDIGFDVLDRNGRAAPWLERKLTAADTARIEQEISTHLGDKGDY